MTWNPLQNPSRQVSTSVRHYLSEATLPAMRLALSTPAMPPPKHKTHRNTLTVWPSRYRRLEQMYRFNQPYLDEDITSFISAYTPSGSLTAQDTDPETGERIAVPCDGYNVFALEPPPLRHIEELGVLWLEHYALRTTQRILQMLPTFGEVKGWNINRPEEIPDNDYSIFRYFIWNKSDAPRHVSEPSDPCSLIIAYQPPWILSPHDMKQFVKTAALPVYHEREGSCPPVFNSAQRVWAKLWDICKQKDCPWFVLTNYSDWVFGCFSRGWTRGFVSDIKTADAKGPTVLQCLLYWFVSSMGLPDVNAYVIPEVPEMVEYLDPNFSTPSQSVHELDATGGYAPSESFWSGQSDDARSSAGVDEDGLVINSPPYVTPDRQFRAPYFPATAEHSIDVVHQWLVLGELPEGLTPPYIPDHPSPVMSEWSACSTDTVRDKPAGGFLSIVPPMGAEDLFA